MYNYPFLLKADYFHPIAITPDKHTMGNSLFKYLDLKVHPLIISECIKTIRVSGCFDRNRGISLNEKGNKLFNFMRPTISFNDDIAELSCFPGIDYVFHFSNIIASYNAMKGKSLKLICDLPNEAQCWNELEKSTLKFIPKVDTVIMGYVEALDFLSLDKEWKGEGNFSYKSFQTTSGNAILLGCKHTFWGEIAGRIVQYLSQLGVKRIIYSGKLGTLVPEYIPNQTIATGNSSILPNGEIIVWENLFDSVDLGVVKKGVHITVPSVLQETTEWLQLYENTVSFVDPEIGHMAYAAKNAGIEYSYFHIISDNLSKKYPHDLSNERKNEVLDNRRFLLKIIGSTIKNL